MRTGGTLELTVTGSGEERGDRWAVWSNEFGFTVYGKTRAEADEAFVEALTTLINSFGDDGLLRDYLDRKGVLHRFVREAPGSQEREAREAPDETGEPFELNRVEVEIGAAA